jgi:hypothetical protein
MPLKRGRLVDPNRWFQPADIMAPRVRYPSDYCRKKPERLQLSCDKDPRVEGMGPVKSL